MLGGWRAECRRTPSGIFVRAIAIAPATGVRHRETGAVALVDEHGNCWASSSFAAGNLNAGGLHLKRDAVNPVNNHNRAWGLSVRCVQHLRLLSFHREPLYAPMPPLSQSAAPHKTKTPPDARAVLPKGCESCVFIPAPNSSDRSDVAKIQKIPPPQILVQNNY